MSDAIPKISSAKKQYLHPVTGKVFGRIPEWIRGSLYMNGPALFEVGPDRYNHLFDGLAMIQRYNIKDGEVKFNSQYIHSKSYHKNKTANRIVVSEFGTIGYPDPCRSIFDRISNYFSSEMTDNTSVTVYNLGDEVFTATETNVIHRIDPVELTTLGSIRLDKIVSVHRATAHFHKDIDSDKTYLLGFINNPPKYALVSMPSIKRKELDETCDKVDPKYAAESLLKEAKLEVEIPVRWKFNPSYMHSFALTPNFFIILESPLTLSLPKLAKALVMKSSFANAFSWWPNETTKVHVVDRKTGKPYSISYTTNAMFTFHHINAFEDEGYLIVDYCGYNSGEVVTDLTLKNISQKIDHAPSVKRLVLPLSLTKSDANGDGLTNLIKYPNSECVAKLMQDGKDGLIDPIVHVTPEVLSECPMELPTINYGHYNGKKYRYSYGISKNVFKLDAITKNMLKWAPDNLEQFQAMECTFIPDPSADPNNPEHEDFGILLCPVIINANTDSRYQSLYVLNARTLTELGHAEFTDVSIPMTFHGLFKST